MARRAAELAAGAADATQIAVRLFYFVRDRIRYNPFASLLDETAYRASATLERGEGYCVQKAVLLAALARASAIPTRLCFADLRNLCVPGELLELMGTDLFTYHGYCQMRLNDRWVKATPAFDRAMCERHGFRTVEFDGRGDAVFLPTTLDGRPHIEYVRSLGCHADLPIHEIIAAFIEVYGQRNPELVRQYRSARNKGT